MRLGVHRQFDGVLRAIGAKEEVCPSPLLSAMVAGCLETGRDFYGGGPRYHMFAPLMTGISTVADSLFVIKTLVFSEGRFTLEDLVACLRADWGECRRHRSQTAQATDHRNPRALFAAAKVWDRRVVRRRIGPRSSSAASSRQCTKCAAASASPAGFAEIKRKYHRPEQPFVLLLTPGVGTFEQYAFGAALPARLPRAQGKSIYCPRLVGGCPCPKTSIHSGFTTRTSAVPSTTRQASLHRSLASWNHASINQLSDALCRISTSAKTFP